MKSINELRADRNINICQTDDFGGGRATMGKCFIVFSRDLGWDHVSASYSNRCPTWEEMCKLKKIFWENEDVVMQLHPKKSEYVNNFPYCLHLLKPQNTDIPTPPTILV